MSRLPRASAARGRARADERIAAAVFSWLRTLCDDAYRSRSYGKPAPNSVLQITIPVCYLATGLLLIAGLRAPSGQPGRNVLLAIAVPAAAALAVHSVALYGVIARSADMKLSIGNTSSLIGWAIAVLGLAAVVRPRLRGLGAVLLLAAAALALGTGADSRLGTIGDAPPWQLGFHILSSAIAYSLFIVAAMIAVLMIYQDRRLRRGRPGGWTALLPPLQTTERTLFYTIGAGVALLSLSIFSGLFFVRDLYGQHLTHKIALTLLSWLVFTALLVGRWRFGWRGRTAVRFTLWGFALLVLAYFGARFVLEIVLGRQWG